MPIPVGVGMAVAGIAGAAATVHGANKQTESTDQAAQLQYKSTEEALADARAQRAYQQGQYADYLQRLSPYSSVGGPAIQRLSAEAGVPYSGTARPLTMAGPTTPAAPQTFTAPNATPAPTRSLYATIANPLQTFMSQIPAMVTMKAPDGSTNTVPFSEVPHWQQRGAVVVSTQGVS